MSPGASLHSLESMSIEGPIVSTSLDLYFRRYLYLKTEDLLSSHLIYEQGGGSGPFRTGVSSAMQLNLKSRPITDTLMWMLSAPSFLGAFV